MSGLVGLVGVFLFFWGEGDSKHLFLIMEMNYRRKHDGRNVFRLKFLLLQMIG